MVPHNMIRMIVGRRHVGESNLSICKYLVSRMKPGKWRAMPKRSRKAWLRSAVKAHEADIDLYRQVMSGRF